MNTERDTSYDADSLTPVRLLEGMDAAEPPLDGDDPALLRATIARLRAGIASRDRRILELEAIAHADELTGLLNRRGFLQELERAIQLSRRYGMVTSLLYIDLDGFKTVNDQFGHSAGDAALAKLAERLTGALRTSDIVGRLGGDEFAALLWRSDEARARMTAERLISAITAEPIATRRGPARLGASIGAVEIGPEDTAAAVLARADKAMYADKNSRRPRYEG